jgi:hypothetical protein
MLPIFISWWCAVVRQLEGRQPILNQSGDSSMVGQHHAGADEQGRTLHRTPRALNQPSGMAHGPLDDVKGDVTQAEGKGGQYDVFAHWRSDH